MTSRPRRTFDSYLAQVREDDRGCWLLPKRDNGEGYVLISDGPPGERVARKAHRVFYEKLVGPIPMGLQLDHLCRNRSCVNPAHLEPVTLKTNVLRGVGFGASNARKEACVRGHPLTMVNGRRLCRACKNETNRRWRERNTNPKRPLKTACKYGHPLSGDNVYVDGRKRVCRACARRRVVEFKARHAEVSVG